MGIISLIKDVAVVCLALITAVVVSIYLTGSPEAGLVILFMGFVAKASMEKRQNKKLEQKEYISQKTLTQKGLLTKITDQNGVTTVHAHKRYGGTEQDILDFINEKR